MTEVVRLVRHHSECNVEHPYHLFIELCTKLLKELISIFDFFVSSNTIKIMFRRQKIVLATYAGFSFLQALEKICFCMEWIKSSAIHDFTSLQIWG